MAKFVQLPNKVVIDLDNVAYVLRKELDEFIVIPKVSIAPTVPTLKLVDYDALVKYLAEAGDLVALKVEAANDEGKETKIAVASK